MAAVSGTPALARTFHGPLPQCDPPNPVQNSALIAFLVNLTIIILPDPPEPPILGVLRYTLNQKTLSAHCRSSWPYASTYTPRIA